MPGSISDVCQGHRTGERYKEKSAGSIKNVCLECRRGKFLHGVVWKQSGGSGKNKLLQGLSKIIPGQGGEGRKAWGVS